MKQKSPAKDNVKNENIKEEYFDSLPPGWKVKSLEVGFGNIVKKFVNPSCKVFNSRIEAVREWDCRGVDNSDPAGLGRDDTVDLVTGDQHLVQYHAVSSLIDDGSLQLIWLCEHSL